MAYIPHDSTYEERKELLAKMSWEQKVHEASECIQYIAFNLSMTEYFAFSVLNVMHKVPVKPEVCDTMGVRVTRSGNIELQYNPDFFLLMSLHCRFFVVNHEVLHCTFHHITLNVPPDRFQHELFNIAHDLAINTILMSMSNVEMPTYGEDIKDPKTGEVLGKKGDKQGCYPKHPKYDFDDHLTAQNYLYLLKKKFQDQEPDKDCPLHGDGEGDEESDKGSGGDEEDENENGQGGEGNEGGEGDQEGDGKGKGDQDGDGDGDQDGGGEGQGNGQGSGHGHGDSDKICTCKKHKGGLPYNHLGDHSGWGESENADYADMMIRSALESAERQKGDRCWGNIGGNAIAAIKAAQEAEVAWEKLLRFEIGRFLSVKRRKSYSKPNRRGVPYHTYVGTKKKQMDRFLVAIDTSGSVDDSELAKFLTEVNSLVSKGYFVDLILFDHGLVWDKARKFSKQLPEMNFEGRGGTEFSAPIKYAQENQYKTLIMLTDGGAGDPGQPENLDVLWVITPGGMNPPDWGMDRYVQMELPASAERAPV